MTADEPVILWNRRGSWLVGCTFYTVALMVLPLCVIKWWVGAVWFALVVFFLNFSRNTPYVRTVHLADRLTVRPFEMAFIPPVIERVTLGPDPLEDYSDDEQRLYELTFVARSGERVRLIVTAEDARRAVAWAEGKWIRVVLAADVERDPRFRTPGEGPS